MLKSLDVDEHCATIHLDLLFNITGNGTSHRSLNQQRSTTNGGDPVPSPKSKELKNKLPGMWYPLPETKKTAIDMPTPTKDSVDGAQGSSKLAEKDQELGPILEKDVPEVETDNELPNDSRVPDSKPSVPKNAEPVPIAKDHKRSRRNAAEAKANPPEKDQAKPKKEAARKPVVGVPKNAFAVHKICMEVCIRVSRQT